MRIIYASIILLLIFTANTYADSVKEAELRAAYLYNFANFISWPEDVFVRRDSPLVIAIPADSTMKDPLRQIEGKKVQNRPIEIKTYNHLGQVELCHMLYVPAETLRKNAVWMKQHNSGAVVTVSDLPDFTKQGGIIELIDIRGRLRFIINLGAARNKALKIDSQLLALAIDIVER